MDIQKPQIRDLTNANHTHLTTATGGKLNGLAYNSTSNPTVNNDGVDTAVLGRVFSIGDEWVNTTTDIVYVCTDNSTGAALWRGLVNGPSSATDNAVTRYDATTGKIIQDSLTTVDDTGLTIVNAPMAGNGLMVQPTGTQASYPVIGPYFAMRSRKTIADGGTGNAFVDANFVCRVANASEWYFDIVDNRGYVVLGVQNDGRVLICPATSNNPPSPQSTFEIQGSFASQSITYTSSGTYTAGEVSSILCNTSTGNIIINLPTASTVAQRIYYIAKIDTSSNTVTVEGITLKEQKSTVTFQSDGIAWRVISRSTIDADLPPIYINGNGYTITTGSKGDIVVPFDCTLKGYTVLADQVGSIQIDLWKCTYSQYSTSTGGVWVHPVVGDSIVAAAPVTISSNVKGQSSTLSGWTTNLIKGDIIRTNVNSCTAIQRITLALNVVRV